MREVFTSIIKTHKPEKFNARVIESGKYGFNLKFNFGAANYINQTYIKSSLAAFF